MMFRLLFLLLNFQFLFFYNVCCENFEPRQVRDNKNRRNTTEWLSYWGYPSETHYARTEDGYILTLHHIIPKCENSPPILLQHGVLMASDSFVLQGENDLAIMLHEEGYDIWFGNVRGNFYSENHDYLDVKDEKFWDFSWHEHGYYDLPATIDFILNNTNMPSLTYIGFSMGTTIFYVMASTRPEYNNKIKFHISLAPVAYSSRMKNYPLVFRPILDNKERIINFTKNNHIFQILKRRFPPTFPMSCEIRIVRMMFCNPMLSLFIGPDSQQIPETEIWSRVFYHFPAGSSIKTLLHYGQLIKSGDFVQYDYGRLENMKRYGHSKPPRYKLDKINIPMVLFSAPKNDYFSHPTDVRLLTSQISNLVGLFTIPYTNFNHFDFLYAKDAKTIYFNSVLCLVNVYNNKVSNKPCYIPENSLTKSDILKAKLELNKLQ